MGGHNDAQLDKEARKVQTEASIRFSESCAARTAKTTLEGAAAGAFWGAARLSWYPDPFEYGMKNTRVPLVQNAAYVLHGLRAPVVWCGLVSGVYGLTECLVEQLRDPQRESTWVNAVWGGAAAGAVLGGWTRRFDYMAIGALGTGLVMGMAEYVYIRQGTEGPAGRILDGDKWWLPVRPESDAVKALKEQYPEWKNL